MNNRLYVGNLSYSASEVDLQDLFSQAGKVQDVSLILDKFSGKSRGFAFVTMVSEEDANNAITQFNGKTIDGRALTVNLARPREERQREFRPSGGGGGPQGAGGGGRRDFGERSGGGGGRPDRKSGGFRDRDRDRDRGDRGKNKSFSRHGYEEEGF